MSDLISRQAVLEMAYDMSEIDGEHFTEPHMVVDVEDIQKLQSVNPKTGYWISRPPYGFKCSRCLVVHKCPSIYCPSCGTKTIASPESEG